MGRQGNNRTTVYNHLLTINVSITTKTVGQDYIHIDTSLTTRQITPWHEVEDTGTVCVRSMAFCCRLQQLRYLQNETLHTTMLADCKQSWGSSITYTYGESTLEIKLTPQQHLM